MRVMVEQLSKKYGKNRHALREINLGISGGVVGLVGANGAGKTTLVRILSGVLKPTSGTVTVGGRDLQDSTGRRAVREFLGYLPQEFNPYPELTGREFLDYIALLKRIEAKEKRQSQVERLLDQVALTADAHRRISEYSTGMKRRLGIAQALLGEPRFIIVDEPTANLDPQERMRFRSLLASLGDQRTIILATHILGDIAQTCSQVIVLDAGQLLYHGSTQGLTEKARGLTYTVVADQEPAAATGVVVNAYPVQQGMHYRVVGNAPSPDARLEEPNLEDGYAALIHLARQRSGLG